MSRYIDADKLTFSRVRIIHPDGTAGGWNAVVMSSVINNAPTADVDEVVRCRDCIHNRDNGGDCDRTIILNEYDSTEYRCAGLEYCSYGKRRKE